MAGFVADDAADVLGWNEVALRNHAVAFVQLQIDRSVVTEPIRRSFDFEARSC